MDTPELIKKAKSGHTAAQKGLYDRFADQMMVVCCRYVRSREDAEELMLDGFFKFFHHLPAFHYQGDAALYAWLKRIMINECLMFLRKRGAFTIVAETDAQELALQEEALDNLSAAEILNLVVQLPVGYRTVFNLYAIEGMPHAEIAQLLGISEGTSKSQLSKAKTLLQKALLKKQTHYGRQKSK
ncbi:MAG: sigma-70 family RNA polymerase sigma factor [Williamsia sp.]|nr:sigma-70 family RNA polymerase sigma factor [Williamsia sp.]